MSLNSFLAVRNLSKSRNSKYCLCHHHHWLCSIWVIREIKNRNI